MSAFILIRSEHNGKDKIKQYISQFGGMLALLYLALQASGIEVEYLNPDHVQPWINF